MPSQLTNYSGPLPNITLSYVLPIEAHFSYELSHFLIERLFPVTYVAVALYLLTIVVLQREMRNRAAIKLQGPLFAWNLGLAIFSVLGFLRTYPELRESLRHGGLLYSVCVASNVYHPSATGFWVALFGLSKILELGDTVFIILRKRPVIFLHGYHHCTVLLFAWYTYLTETAVARWFCVLNFFVHSLMYTYLALSVAGFRIPLLIKGMVTMCQLAQMAVGVCVVAYAIYMKQLGVPCQTPNDTLFWAVVIYCSYFFLFLHFFYVTFIKQSNSIRSALIKGPRNLEKQD